MKEKLYFYVMLLMCLGGAFILQMPVEAHSHTHSKTHEGFVNNEGVNIFYRLKGKEHPTTLVFLHGFASTREEFICQMNNLSEFFQTVAIDLRGFGRSDHSSLLNLSYPAMASDVHKVIQTLNIENPIIIGFSMGSVVAEQYAATYSNISKLILISPFAGQLINANGWTLSIDPAFIAPFFQLAQTNKNAANEALTNITVPETCSKVQKIKDYINRIGEQTSTEIIFKIAETTAIEGIQNLLPAISVPTLLIFGNKDILINRDGVFYLRKVLADSRLVELPGGHELVITQSSLINKEIFDFVTTDPADCHTCL